MHEGCKGVRDGPVLESENEELIEDLHTSTSTQSQTRTCTGTPPVALPRFAQIIHATMDVLPERMPVLVSMQGA